MADPLLIALFVLGGICIVALIISGTGVWMAQRDCQKSLKRLEETHRKYYG